MSKETRVMSVSVITNIFLSILKIISGFLLKSAALFADGIHSLSDLLTDFFAIIGNILAKKPADLKHPYGHGKIEYLTSIGISLVIIFLGLSIINNSIHSKAKELSLLVSLVSLITIFVKYLLSLFIIKKGKEYHNNILIASGKESRADVISSLVVFISAILTLFSKYINILKYSDIIAGIIVGILIIKTGFLILKENTSIILGEQETDSKIYNSIRKIILKSEYIKTIDNLVILKFGHAYEVKIEVSMSPDLTLLKSHDIIDNIENEIKQKQEKVEYITIHVNPYKELPNFILEKATKNDLNIIKEGIKETDYMDEIDDCAKEKIKDTHIIKQNNKKIGVVISYKQKDYYFIDTIYIKEKYRYQGIGYNIILNIIKEKRPVRLWTFKDNTKAIKLYKNLGFEIIEETKTRYLMENR